MSIYDEKLSNVIQKYGFHYEGLIDSVTIHNIVMRLFQDRCLTKRTALWGAGRSNSLTSHASVIIDKYASCMRGLVCLIDSAKELQGKQFMDYPIISPLEIKNMGIELIIVASRSSAVSIKESIQKYAPCCEVLDIYQELRECGIVIPYNFYEEHSLYTELYEMRIAYEGEEEFTEKGKKLRELISAYLSIRDIPYAIEFCEIYITQKYCEYKKVEKMLGEIRALVKELKEGNKKRNGDFVIHFIDALRAMDVAERKDGKLEFKYFKKYFENMLYFENAYSTAPTTYESMRSIICGQYPYEVNVYHNNFIFSFDDFPLLSKVWKKGYDITFYASDEYRIMFEDKRIQYVNQIHLPQKLWSLMCDRMEAKNPFFAFLYYPWELHFPLICGYHTIKPHLPGFVDVGIVDMSDYIEQQFNDCLNYVDKEFAFYSEFYNEETYLNIFSDHSQIVYDEDNFMPYYMYYKNPSRSTHCTMAIGGPGMKGIYTDNFSMIDYNKVMTSLLAGEIEIPKKRIIHWQYYSIHNKRFRDVAVKKGYTDYIDGIRCYMFDKYIYACNVHGKKEVYCVNDLSSDIAETDEGKHVIAEIEKELGIPEFPKFLSLNFE